MVPRDTGNRVVTLRDINEPGNRRSLWAALNDDGSLEIEGLDRGDAVEAHFGEREYEWRWRLPPESTAKFHQVLGKDEEFMAALARRFSGDAASDLAQFLVEHGISYEAWSRIGD